MSKCTECPLFSLVQTLLCQEHEHSHGHNIQKVKEIVSFQTGVSVKELESKSRKQHIVRARNIAMKRCREIDINLKRIGDAFNRSHATVIHSIT